MKSSTQILSLVLTVLLAATCCSAGKKNRNVHHGHNGKLTPYKPGPFAVKLTGAEEAKLMSGNAVMKQSMPTAENPGGGAICVQDVEAPVDAVWHQILDMDSYKSKVSKVNENKNYVVKKQGDGRVNIKTKQVLGVMPGYSYESYFDHTYHPKESSLTWSLDYDKTSDFEDVSGHWHVTEHPSRGKSCSRVFYACDIEMKGHVPGPVLNIISKSALKQATSWVKKESEAHPDMTIPVACGGSGVKKATSEPELAIAGGASPRRLWGRKQ